MNKFLTTSLRVIVISAITFSILAFAAIFLGILLDNHERKKDRSEYQQKYLLKQPQLIISDVDSRVFLDELNKKWPYDSTIIRTDKVNNETTIVITTQLSEVEVTLSLVTMISEPSRILEFDVDLNQREQSVLLDSTRNLLTDIVLLITSDEQRPQVAKWLENDLQQSIIIKNDTQITLQGVTFMLNSAVTELDHKKYYRKVLMIKNYQDLPK